jgi:O-antigen/teichoic acid export membrane protein
MSASPSASLPAHQGGAVFARMGRNLAWLLGGRGFQAVASLLYLGLAARTLGPVRFGEFTLVLAYGQAIANVAQFQSWQTVIRYGTIHIAAGARDRLGRLLGLTTLFDGVGAILGAIVAAAGVALAAGWLGWDAAERGRAAWFGVALLLSIGATPTGMLRLVDRFDLTTWCQAVGPLVRLAASIAAWATDGGIGLFLAGWAAAALLQHGATWFAALTRTGLPVAIGGRRTGRAVRENEGIWRFALTTNAAGTVGLLGEQLATLAVGGAAGATAAGGFRIASKVARALAKPIQIAARVLYPELARLQASADHATLDHVMARVSRYAIGLSLAVVVVALAGGGLLIGLLAGPGYGFARDMLVVMAIGVAIDLSGFALEPLLVAHGRAGTVLAIRVAGTLLLGLLIALLLPTLGAMAAAVATVAASLAMRVALGRAAAVQ